MLSALPGRLRVRHVARRRFEELEALRDSLGARPEVDAVEVNPLRVTADGLLALDAVVTLEPGTSPGESPLQEAR